MRFIVIAIGHNMPSWVDAGFNEYAKRIPDMELMALKPAKAGNKAAILQAEYRQINAACPKSCTRIVLDSLGKCYTTLELAAELEKWMAYGKDLAFILGGAEGLHPSLKLQTPIWSLSPLTLPHGLARIVVAEQLYRATSLLQHHPYHRA